MTVEISGLGQLVTPVVRTVQEMPQWRLERR
jgi:hypothetical protein